mmetsp:Transcript_17192/g.56960  ORF Transcript_17192/g.56960 Transcript_17192/m.56960 type:complete len:105 (+) Transcript_17192:1203-1517(+)
MKGDAVWPAVNGQGPWLELNVSVKLRGPVDLKSLRQVVDEDVGEFLREGLSKVSGGAHWRVGASASLGWHDALPLLLLSPGPRLSINRGNAEILSETVSTAPIF